MLFQEVSGENVILDLASESYFGLDVIGTREWSLLEAGLIEDDCILLDPGENEVTAIGGFPGIRLFPDSLNAVFHETAGFTHYTPWSDKQQLILKNEAGEALSEPRQLNAIFLLDDPGEIEQGEAVCIEPVTGSAAMMAMIYCAFSLDPSDRQMITHNFRNIGQAINERLGIYSLRYPRVHDRLPEVREAVLEWVDPGDGKK